MRKSLGLTILAAALLGPLSAHAASIAIVNLNADPSKGTPNAGKVTAQLSAGTTFGGASTAYAYNPVTLTNLAIGYYTVSVIGIAGGGSYDAYTPAVPTAGNYTDAFWSVDTNGTAQTQQTVGANSGRYATAALAYAAYSAVAPFTFSVTSVGQAVSFYLDDAAANYFYDDAGGISLGINKAVPEPLTLGLFGIGLAGIAASRRKRRTLVAA